MSKTESGNDVDDFNMMFAYAYRPHIHVGRIWNALPCDEVDFSSLRRFRNSLTAKVLAWYCSLNFI